MTTIPQVLVQEAENKAAEYQLGRILAEKGTAPHNWNPDHPCEFGVFQRRKSDYTVGPLFPAFIADMRKDGFRCVYRTDTGAS